MKLGRPLPLYFRVYSDGTVDTLSFTAEPPADRLGWMEVTDFCPVGCPDNPKAEQLLESILGKLGDIHGTLIRIEHSEGIEHGGN